MSIDIKGNAISKILAELAVYQNPDILLPEYSSLLDTTKVDNIELTKYYELISNIDYAWKKTLRYEKYFSDFYPPHENIGEIEVLNHHIHSYFEDMTILKNKVTVFLGTLKNDAKKGFANKKEINEFFDAAIEKTYEVFAGIAIHREPHHHRGRRFFDGDLLRAENAEQMMGFIENPVFGDMIKPEAKSQIMAEHQKEKEESFESAKRRWIETARKNGEQTSGYINDLMGLVRQTLYQFLNVVPDPIRQTRILYEEMVAFPSWRANWIGDILSAEWMRV